MNRDNIRRSNVSIGHHPPARVRPWGVPRIPGWFRRRWRRRRGDRQRGRRRRDAAVLRQRLHRHGAAYKNTATDKKTRDLIKQLADTNGDGTISTAEVAKNALLANLLAGDVDVDKDGEKELSLGLGLTAVPCVIAEFKGF